MNINLQASLFICTSSLFSSVLFIVYANTNKSIITSTTITDDANADECCC